MYVYPQVCVYVYMCVFRCRRHIQETHTWGDKGDTYLRRQRRHTPEETKETHTWGDTYICLLRCAFMCICVCLTLHLTRDVETRQLRIVTAQCLRRCAFMCICVCLTLHLTRHRFGTLILSVSSLCVYAYVFLQRCCLYRTWEDIEGDRDIVCAEWTLNPKP